MNALRRTWRPACGYLLAIGLVALFTGIVALVRSLVDAANVSMVYLLAVIATAIAGGSRPAILAALASFLAFNFFFIEPHYTFRVANDDEWVALALLLATGVVTGQLAAALRDRAIEAERREKEAVVLYDVVRLVSEPQLEEAMTAVAERLRNELRLSGVLMSLSGDSPLVVRAEAGDSESLRVAREAASLPERILGSGQAPTAAERGTLRALDQDRSPAGANDVPAAPPWKGQSSTGRPRRSANRLDCRRSASRRTAVLICR